jgi:GNAT superfamily N-acetyltransferase
MKIEQVAKQDIETGLREVWENFNKKTGEDFTKENYYFRIKHGGEAGFLAISLAGGVAVLKDLILISEFRNKKLGHELMDFYIDFARKHKCHKMRIKTNTVRSPAAYHLYKKYKFTKETELKNDYLNKDWVILSRYLEDESRSKSED